MEQTITSEGSNGSALKIVDATFSQLSELEADLRREADALAKGLDAHDLRNMHRNLSGGLAVLAELPGKLEQCGDPMSALVLPGATALAEQSRKAQEIIAGHRNDPIVFLPLMIPGGSAFPMKKIEELRALIA